MKTGEYLVVAILTILFGFQLYLLTSGITNPIAGVLALALYLLVILTFIFRTKLVFKAWGLSKWNFLTSRESSTIESDIDRELLLDKLVEVVKESDFTLTDVNKQNFEVLAITHLSFLSWGENLYIELLKSGSGSTNIRFTSVTLFGRSYGRNKRNYQKFCQLFEESLTI